MYGGRGLSSLVCAVLSPVSGTAKLKMNVKMDGDTSMPQVSAAREPLTHLIFDLAFDLHDFHLRGLTFGCSW